MISLPWDYAVFAVFVVASTAFPIWDEWHSSRGQVTTKRRYVFATGRVSVFAVMMSMARGTVGIRSIIGYPSEIFYRGSAMFECIYGIMIAYPIVMWMFVPVYYRLQLTSVYEYLDIRFGSRLVRCLSSAIFIVRTLVNMSITIYTPCVAMQTVLAVPFWASLLTLTGISICFTLFGGLKAAITADLIQGLTTIVVSLVVIVKGILISGDVETVYGINRDNGRFQFLHVGDLSTRVDTVSATLGQAFIQMSLMGCQQNLVQRYMSLNTERDIQKTLYLNVPFIAAMYTIPWLCGTVVYAAYAYCDPRRLGYTHKIDEILPFFMLDKLLVIPGMVGLFLGTLFNGALCIYVSNVNSIATVLWEDFVSQLPRFKHVPDARQLFAIKALGVGIAWMAFGCAFLVGMLTGVIEVAQLVSAATTGPQVGVFMLAMLVPVANWKGATAGMIVTMTLSAIWSTGYLWQSQRLPYMETTTSGCTNETFSPWIREGDIGIWLPQQQQSVSTLNSLLPTQDEISPHSRGPFSLTYMYYGVFGTLLTLLVGTVVSWATTTCCTGTNEKPQDVCDDRLLNPHFVRLLHWWRDATKSEANAAVPMSPSPAEKSRSTQTITSPT